MTQKPLNQLTVLVKGAGEMATGIAVRLYRANLRLIVMAEIEHPLAVRRSVSFCEAVQEQTAEVENIKAIKLSKSGEIGAVWEQQAIAVIVDPEWQICKQISFDIVIDATVAKRNLGTTLDEAPLVIGMGPGFTAEKDVHYVIETNRGHNLGRIIGQGEAEANTGVPGVIAGYSKERVLRAPCDGKFVTDRSIGESVKAGETVGTVAGETVTATIDGVIRGLIRPDSVVTKGLKIGDIDPRDIRAHCFTVSDKARALGGAVLEAILSQFNQ